VQKKDTTGDTKQQRGGTNDETQEEET